MSEAPPRTTLRALLAQQRGIRLPTDDVLHMVLPLFRAVAELHGRGRVADLGGGDIIQQADGVLALTSPEGRPPTDDTAAVERVQPAPSSALSIVGQVRVTVDSAVGTEVETLDVRHDPDAPIDRPVYVPGFGAWELELGHQDAATDIFRLGQALACLALGLDFEDSDDLDLFAGSRGDLFRIDPKLNPVLASIIVEMTALNRHERAGDLASLVTRLETWRDQPVALDIERVLARQAGARNRRAAVLSHLRDRLFDLSRRNRLIHFRPTQASVNLTEASVPLVLRLESIRPEQICTWGGDFAEAVLGGKPISLASRLRFEDQPFLPSALDRVIQETRRDRSEYGFSNLRLVVAFLRWRNLKEAPEERITSPLLWLPVELAKKKGVRDQYVLTCDGREAEFNPALRHYLRQLYDIRLPERVDLDATSIADIHADLCAQIQQSEPAVELRLVSKPEIKLIHQKAVQRLNQFQRRRGRTVAPVGGGRPDFSYDPDDYRPLGLALFRTRIQPSPLPLRGAVGAAPTPRAPHMAPDGAAKGVTERATFSRHEDQGHRYAWELDLTQVTLSNLNYRKMSLVRDYAELLDEAPESPAFDRIFSIEPKAIETEPPPALPLAEQWDVVASDATQRAAIALARRKRSFIIQGPPGTGKSQTITNLIADHVARGRRVLFVCEKRAALDVVFHRLRQSGLDDLCCLIHDSQTDKKAFVQDLRETYERWTGEADDLDRLDASRQALVARLEEALGRIERFEANMAGAPESLAVALRALIRRRLELPEPPPGIGQGARERLPDYAAFLKARPLLTQIFGAVRETLCVDSLAAHPFGRISAALVEAPQPYAAIEAALREIEALTDRLDAEPGDGGLLNDGVSLTDAVLLTRAAREIAAHDLAPRLDLLDPASGAAAAFSRERRELEGLATDLAARREAAAGWTDALSPEDAHAALDLARRLEPSPFRWLSADWWRLRGQLRRRYDLGRHAVRPTWVQVLELLNRAHEAAAAQAEAERRLAAHYGATDLAGFIEAVDRLSEDLSARPVLRTLRQRLQTAEDPSALARTEGSLAASAAELAAAAERAVFGWDGMTLGRIGEWARDMQESLEDFPDFLPLLQALDRDHAAVAWTVRSVASTAPQLEALVAAESIARLLRRDPDLAQFDAAALADAVGAASRAERALAEQNARTVRAIRRRRFLDHAKLASRSTTQLDDAGRRFKKQYSAGRSQLEHEFGKSMRHRSVRELASGETGIVINDLKPIWLMSPLSVSDTLPLDPDLFDVVIFDEASQIPTEEAVPALSRARQAVVVGDEMQLPPTRFFTAGVSEDDETVEAEEDGERIAVNLDADSLLSQAARNLPATLLAWHYRSRSEALISFSNAAFYDGRLITVPDAAPNSGGDDLQAVRSDDPGAAASGVDALTARPISFHRVENGVYVDRRNRPEAAYIARLVRELLRREDGLSLGVVAFSEAQQSEIEAALEALADQDTAFGTRLEREYVREDDGQFNGLFVKNLENVQGDERDIILLSICYAPGPDGRMAMNFGPINQRGGEKRLNVIFSRAKHHMAVISTIDAGAITNTHNDGAAALKSFLQFAQASSRGESERSQAVLASLNPSARRVFAAEPAGDSLRSALAEALRSRGLQVYERVGRSGFRCDLAVVDAAESRRYALAVLLDSAGAAAEDARERYVFRPSILRSFGWRVLDLPSKDWLRDPERVLRRIETALQGDEASDAEPLEWEPPVAEALASPLAEPATRQDVREFRSEQGGSSKFWRVGVEDCELTVAFGRIGAKGQTVVKVFDTPDRAVREMRKLIDEKLRKGYVEV